MTAEEFDALVADIQEHGQREAIVLHPDGSILDGRNRRRACQQLGIEPKTVVWDGEPGTELAYVTSANLHRRHLDVSQRAMIAAKMANLPNGQRQLGKFAEVPSQAQAAELMNVSPRSVASTAKVRDEAPAEVVQAVERGTLSVSKAAEQVAERSIRPGPSPEHVKLLAKQRKAAAAWQHLVVAVGRLNVLPPVVDVVAGCSHPDDKRDMLASITRAKAVLAALERELTLGGDVADGPMTDAGRE